MSEIEGVTDYHFEPGAGPVFIGGFQVTDHGVAVTGWSWIVTPIKEAPAKDDPDWSTTYATRDGKTGVLVMDDITPLAEGAYDLHVKYANSDDDQDIIRPVRIFVEVPH